MTSRALATWQNDRTARLDRLEAAHTSLDGLGPGARKLTEELNHALVLRLATEFQGFARDLHDEASYALAASIAPGDPRRQERLRVPYELGRRIDRGNADPGDPPGLRTVRPAHVGGAPSTLPHPRPAMARPARAAARGAQWARTR